MYFKVCLALACLGAALAPSVSASAIPMGTLADLAKKSICQSVVDYDEDLTRIPRLIKQVKCAANPDTMCPAHDGTGGETSCCTQNSFREFSFSCKEVTDTVLVSDASGATSPKIVSVGCACAATKTITAKES